MKVCVAGRAGECGLGQCVLTGCEGSGSAMSVPHSGGRLEKNGGSSYCQQLSIEHQLCMGPQARQRGRTPSSSGSAGYGCPDGMCVFLSPLPPLYSPSNLRGPTHSSSHPPEPASREAEEGRATGIVRASPAFLSPRLSLVGLPSPPVPHLLSPFVTAWTLGREGGNLRE